MAKNSSGCYFPRTKRGWATLFWLTLKRCPTCKNRLVIDPWSFSSDWVYCMPCGGAIYPNGLIASLSCNKEATKTKEKIIGITCTPHGTAESVYNDEMFGGVTNANVERVSEVEYDSSGGVWVARLISTGEVIASHPLREKVIEEEVKIVRDRIFNGTLNIANA